MKLCDHKTFILSAIHPFHKQSLLNFNFTDSLIVVLKKLTSFDLCPFWLLGFTLIGTPKRDTFQKADEKMVNIFLQVIKGFREIHDIKEFNVELFEASFNIYNFKIMCIYTIGFQSTFQRNRFKRANSKSAS